MTTMEQIPQNILDILHAPLPDEAITERPGGKGLSSIKPIYISERLTEAFGAGNWTFKYEKSIDIASSDTYMSGISLFQAKHTGRAGGTVGSRTISAEQIDHAAVTGELFVKWQNEKGEWCEQSYPASGGSTNDDIGDMMKGAVSDALGKAAATYLGVGADVYKGLRKPKSAPKTYAPRTPAVTSSPINQETTTPSCAKCLEENRPAAPMKLIPAGVSKEGRPYNAFLKCAACGHTARA